MYCHRIHKTMLSTFRFARLLKFMLLWMLQLFFAFAIARSCFDALLLVVDSNSCALTYKINIVCNHSNKSCNCSNSYMTIATPTVSTTATLQQQQPQRQQQHQQQVATTIATTAAATTATTSRATTKETTAITKYQQQH